MHDKILILDFGAQYTQLIARRVREAKVYCEIHPCDVSDEFVRSFGARGVILSGSYMSAYEDLIRATSADHAPWFVVPADHKWVRDVAVATLLVDALERLDPQYPPADPALRDLKVQ